LNAVRDLEVAFYSCAFLPKERRFIYFAASFSVSALLFFDLQRNFFVAMGVFFKGSTSESARDGMGGTRWSASPQFFVIVVQKDSHSSGGVFPL
jgi:hypothetical protein